jgi:hypothetical protein
MPDVPGVYALNGVTGGGESFLQIFVHPLEKTIFDWSTCDGGIDLIVVRKTFIVSAFGACAS